jgi:hypothetical protein
VHSVLTSLDGGSSTYTHTLYSFTGKYIYSDFVSQTEVDWIESEKEATIPYPCSVCVCVFYY